MQQHTRDELAKVEFLTRSLTPGKDIFAPIKFIYTLFMVFLGWISLTLEVFARREFGERYFNPVRIIFAWFTLGFYRFFFVLWFSLSNFSIGGSLFGGGSSFNLGATTPFFRLFTWGFLIASGAHILRIYLRNKQGIQWHSQSFGISWFSALPLDDWKLYRFVEPVAFFIVGLILAIFFDRLLGIWIVLAAGSLFLKNQMAYADLRGRYLDLIDSRIESEFLTSAVHGTPKSETKGFSVMPVPAGTVLPEDAASIEETVEEVMG